jgi:hypothetical protein
VTRLLLIIAAFLLLAGAIVFPLPAATQAQENASTSSSPQPPDVSGKWQVTWQGRLGAEQCTLQLHQEGTKLTGTFQDVHGLSSLSGTVDAKQISFAVQFQGPRPFTVQFTGLTDKIPDPGKIDGTSKAVNVAGAGAFLGHGGEIVQPDRPWTAKRVADQPAQSTQTGLIANSPARN